MRKGLSFDEKITAPHMPPQSGRMLFLAAAAEKGYKVQYWNVPGAYMRASNDPRSTLKVLGSL